MPEILFLSHRIPFPPDRGDKIRSHHILKRLAQIAPVHVGTFADDDADFGEEAELATLAETYKLVRREKPLALAGVEALVRGRPVSQTAFHDRALAAYVAEILATRPIAAIYIFSGQMGQYAPHDFGGRLVTDFVDVDSAKFDAYAQKRGGLRKWIDAREGRLLRRTEAGLAERSAVSMLITQAEADLFRSRLPETATARQRIAVLPNGIDSRYFDPSLTEPEPRMGEFGGPRLIFTGQMDYAPNVEAALRVAGRLMPLLRQTAPDASFHVVGRNPTQALLDRDGRDGCRVWGRVDDVRPWLKAADLAVAPLDIARGVQNKVLEAMAMELPVALTRAAATGIDAIADEHFVVADSDEALTAAIAGLAGDASRARRMGIAARRYVVENASWEAALAPLAEIIGRQQWSGLHAA